MLVFGREEEDLMRLAIRFLMALALVITVIACSRPTEETPSAAPATSAQPSPATPPSDTATPAAEKSDRPQSTAERQAAPPAKSGSPSKSAGSKADTPKSAAEPEPEVANIPAGTTLTVTMIDAVGTDTSKVGDTFMA